MTPMPRVSVVMPMFNARRYVADSVASVLASDFRDLELLLLDDGSTDGSVEIAREAAAGDDRVRIFLLAHGGVGAARNAGLTHARGEFIANLDADDIMLPARLSRQIAYLDRNPGCVAVGSRALVITATGSPVRIVGRLFSHQAIDEAHLDGRPGAMLNPTATFRRQAALDVGGYATHLRTTGEDHDLWLRLAEVGLLANLPDVLIRYRVHDGNTSLGRATADRRRSTTLATVERAFERRGIADRRAERGTWPAPRASERLADTALLHFYRGRRRQAFLPAIAAWLLSPFSLPVRSTLRTVVSEGSPA
jgi:glycosyltransferase involved in cell wall biosynthesis